MENTKNLFQRLAEVRKECNFIKKEAVGANLKYKAVSSDMVLSAINNSVNTHGLFLITDIASEKIIAETKDNGYGKLTTSYTCELKLIYTWVNIDKPEDKLSINWSCSALNTDPAKANGATLTYAEKYFFLKFFNMVSSENEKLDPDCQAVPEEKSEVKKSYDKSSQNKPVEQPKKETNFSTPVPVKETSKVTDIQKPSTKDKIISILNELIKNKDTFEARVKDLVSSYITSKDIDLNSYDWFKDHVIYLSASNKIGIDQKSFNEAMRG